MNALDTLALLAAAAVLLLGGWELRCFYERHTRSRAEVIPLRPHRIWHGRPQRPHLRIVRGVFDYDAEEPA